MKTASPAVPLFVAASLGAFAGLCREWPVAPLVLGVACGVVGVLLARGAAARAALLLALAFTLAMTGAAVELARHAQRRQALPSDTAFCHSARAIASRSIPRWLRNRRSSTATTAFRK